MSWLSSARAIARGVFRRSEIHHELEEELRAHIQNRSDDLQRSGLSKQTPSGWRASNLDAIPRWKKNAMRLPAELC